MAITKYKVINKNLQAVINYAKNGEKTEHEILVSGINCLPENAYYEMMLTKKAFHKENGRQGYHFIQSFKGDEVSARQCNRIGMELAQQLWGDKYQVLVCTHTNKENVHNHIVLNSVSFIDGSKYHNSNVEIALLRETSDDLCRKHDLSVVETKRSKKEQEITRSRIRNYNRNEGKMEIIKTDIDEAIKEARKYQEFIAILQYKGYYLKKRYNGLSISTPYYNRNIRLARAFGVDYTFENIKHRIYYNSYTSKDESNKIYKVRIYDGIKINSELLKTSSFYRLYVHYLYLFGKLPPKIHYEERTKEYYKEIDKLEKLSEEIRMIANYDLKNTQETQELKNKFTDEANPLKDKREKLWKVYNKTNDMSQKLVIKGKIEKLTEEINKINRKIQTCNRIIKQAEKGAKEQKLIEQRKEENQLKNDKQVTKDKRRIR